MSDALAKQVGGTHYKGMKVQPIEFAMRNHWDSCAFSILKYLGRHDKPTGKGLIDIQKASHFVELREALSDYTHSPNVPLLQVMAMDFYCSENEIIGMERKALHWLELWVRHPSDKSCLQSLKDSINRLLSGNGLTDGQDPV